ncbi:MAG: class I tRNA ligase family protein, partial [Pseudomonadota bacterium]
FSGDDAAARDETQKAAAWVFARLLHTLHPLMPFLTEELWADLSGLGNGSCGKGDWLIERAWPTYEPSLIDADARAEMEWIIALITQVRAVRAEMNVPAGARIPLVLSSASETATQRVTTHSGLIERLARVSALTIDPGPAPKGSVQIVLDGATAALPIADVIDIGQERARLNKELEKHQGEIAAIDKKLSNKNFVDKAPEAVVEEQKTRRQAAEENHSRVTAALVRLEEIA